MPEPPLPGGSSAASSDGSLATAARLVRAFHAPTADSPPAGGQEVVCHDGLSPENTVHRLRGGELRPAAFIDWGMISW
ncbi:hypothetical protein [Streptomyces sp. NRRL F-5650]|uniref:hypothetical protein n=1 Tax=Streptomyces sp. NRRL F-5650 TaxID=1463868 RepID=UPI0004CB9F6D|nr:hypothetical protein [Streptomyces sp. NRRL F-5650]